MRRKSWTSSPSGAIAWARHDPSVWFWYLLRVAQAVVVIQVTLGLILLATNHRAGDDLHYAYGVSLVKSGDPKRAADVFSRLIARSGDSAALHVMLGDAHAQQGDFAGAEAFVRRVEVRPLL